MKVRTGSSFKKRLSPIPPFACNAGGQQIAETGTHRTLPYLPCEQKQICNAYRRLRAGGRKGRDGISARDFSGGDSSDITVLCRGRGMRQCREQPVSRGREAAQQQRWGGKGSSASCSTIPPSWVHAWHPHHPACLPPKKKNPTIYIYFLIPLLASRNREMQQTGQKSNNKTLATNIFV